MNCFTVFLQIAAEMWVVKMFPEHEKAKGSVMLIVGMNMGIFTMYNIFVPLNSVAWLNKYIFTSSPRTEPLITHSGIVSFIAVVSLSIGLYVVLFVAEKQIENESNKQTFSKIAKTITRFFT